MLALVLLSVLSAGLAADDDRNTAPAATHGIAWVIQVTDMHISKYVHPDIAPDLEVFGSSVVAGVRPSALLLTGDLVDAKTSNGDGSKQHDEEWQVGAAA